MSLVRVGTPRPAKTSSGHGRDASSLQDATLPEKSPVPPKHDFPKMPETTESRFEDGGSKRWTIHRKQVPIEPGFSMTAHEAQGRMLGHVVVDLKGCSGQPSL